MTSLDLSFLLRQMGAFHSKDLLAYLLILQEIQILLKHAPRDAGLCTILSSNDNISFQEWDLGLDFPGLTCAK